MKGYIVYNAIQQLKERGFKRAAVAKQLNIDRRTVSRYWDMTADEYEKYLERKRRENFRRMMDEAAAERKAELRGGKREKPKNRAAEAPARQPNQESPAETGTDLPDTGETDLEKEIAAAVEAAVRAKLDPEQALDEVFAELSREDGDAEGSLGAAETLFSKAPSELPPDMLELLDFDEPGGDSAAYTDHSLAEFAAGRASEHAVKKTKSRKEPEDGED